VRFEALPPRSRAGFKSRLELVFHLYDNLLTSQVPKIAPAGKRRITAGQSIESKYPPAKPGL